MRFRRGSRVGSSRWCGRDRRNTCRRQRSALSSWYRTGDGRRLLGEHSHSHRRDEQGRGRGVRVLKDPITIRTPPFEMPDRERKITFLNRLQCALAADPHNATGRRPEILPIPTRHRILVHSTQKRFGRPCELDKRLGIHLTGKDAPDFLRGGIQCESVLNFNPFCQEICFLFTLHDHLPVLSDCSQCDSDQDNRKHDRQIGHTS